jgi:hypothetical protein
MIDDVRMEKYQVLYTCPVHSVHSSRIQDTKKGGSCTSGLDEAVHEIGVLCYILCPGGRGHASVFYSLLIY